MVDIDSKPATPQGVVMNNVELTNEIHRLQAQIFSLASEIGILHGTLMSLQAGQAL